MHVKRLYIADDTEGFRTLVRKLAETHGWQVTECDNGRELLDALAECSDPGVIFMDLQMPEMDGIETLQELAKRSDTRRVFIITGGPSSNASAAQLMSQARGLAVEDVLYKPVALGTLNEILAPR